MTQGILQMQIYAQSVVFTKLAVGTSGIYTRDQADMESDTKPYKTERAEFGKWGPGRVR